MAKSATWSRLLIRDVLEVDRPAGGPTHELQCRLIEVRHAPRRALRSSDPPFSLLLCSL